MKQKKEREILTNEKNGQVDLSKLKDFIVKSLDYDKALDIEAINIGAKSALADYIIIASGTSSTHVKSIADRLIDRLTTSGMKNIRTEGSMQGDWVIVDAGDIIIHVFRPEVREFYNIEKMWAMDFTPTGNKQDNFQLA